MHEVRFDTLRLARRLEAAGLAGPVATGASEALAEAMSGAELATKPDMKVSEVALRSEIELLRRDMTIRLGGMMALGVGVMVTAMRLMLLHP